MMFLVSSEDILMIFISLELTSLSLYILTAFNKRNVKSAEAALKYFLFGGMAAAFTLFGLSLLYGLSGATNLARSPRRSKAKGSIRCWSVAIVMTVIGFGFKVAAVPFHLWAPDAYQGAPTPSAALIASGSKVASFFIFAKVMMIGFAGAEGSGALARLCAGLGAGAGDRGGGFDGAGQSGRDCSEQRAAVARLFGHRPCGLHAAGRAVARRPKRCRR